VLVHKQINEEERRWKLDRLVELSEALDLFHSQRALQDGREQRAKIRALVSALPGNYAILAGHHFGVPRANYPGDARQVLDVADVVSTLGDDLARLEVEWNLQEIQRLNHVDSAFLYIMHRYDSVKNSAQEQP
jgi:hypothetical protein